MNIQFINYPEERVSEVLESKEVQLSCGTIRLDGEEIAVFQGEMWLYDDQIWTDVVMVCRKEDDA